MRSYNLPLPAHFTVSRHEQVIVCAGGAVEVWDPRAQVREDGAGPGISSARARSTHEDPTRAARHEAANERTDGPALLPIASSRRHRFTLIDDVDVDVDRPPPGSAPSRRKMQMRVWCA